MIWWGDYFWIQPADEKPIKRFFSCQLPIQLDKDRKNIACRKGAKTTKNSNINIHSTFFLFGSFRPFLHFGHFGNPPCNWLNLNLYVIFCHKMSDPRDLWSLRHEHELTTILKKISLSFVIGNFDNFLFLWYFLGVMIVIMIWYGIARLW